MTPVVPASEYLFSCVIFPPLNQGWPLQSVGNGRPDSVWFLKLAHKSTEIPSCSLESLTLGATARTLRTLKPSLWDPWYWGSQPPALDSHRRKTAWKRVLQPGQASGEWSSCQYPAGPSWKTVRQSWPACSKILTHRNHERSQMIIVVTVVV